MLYSLDGSFFRPRVDVGSVFVGDQFTHVSVERRRVIARLATGRELLIADDPPMPPYMSGAARDNTVAAQNRRSGRGRLTPATVPERAPQRCLVSQTVGLDSLLRRRGETGRRSDQTAPMQSGSRAKMLRSLADAVASLQTPHPVRVAVDGRPASGKTTLADELGIILGDRGRRVIRATIDEFLFPKAVRYRRGIDSPDGCYDDSFDFDALHRALLDPLGPRGDRAFQTSTYDREGDRVLVLSPTATAPGDAVLLFDGVFLMRPELNDDWDLRILVLTSFDETLRRARRRDSKSLGSIERVEERFRVRYGPSQEHYFETIRPTDIADVVLHNEDPDRPAWEIRSH
jgi:uridine kinase